MDEELRREIALFRFSLIAPILNNTYPNKTVKDYLEEICAIRENLNNAISLLNFSSI